MKKNEFYKDKYKKINRIINHLSNFKDKSEFDNEDMHLLREFSQDLLEQVHELNAGRNIFLDNDNQQSNNIKLQ